MISVPSKVFLLGEYSVLAGGKAWLAAIDPRFEFEKSPASHHPHSKSPLGRLQRSAEIPGFQMRDPHKGAGGFGGSTAEFIAGLVCTDARLDSVQEHHARYQSLYETSERIPSGADLVVQWTGGSILFSQGPYACEQLTFNELPIAIFSASHQSGRKTATHQALEAFDERVLPLIRAQADPIVGGVGSDLRDMAAIGGRLSAYGDLMAAHGLECEATALDRAAFKEITGVLGVKGSGALQSDSIQVAYNHPAVLSEIKDVAHARNLRLLSESLKPVPGVQVSECL